MHFGYCNTEVDLQELELQQVLDLCELESEEKGTSISGKEHEG